MTSMIDLNGQDWQFKEFYGEDWSWRDSVKPATRDVRWWRNGTVPGSVHHDLLKLGEIPNPYYERNSLLCEWIPARTWIYKKSFHVENELRGKRIHLHFEGVDYQARFFLNGIQIGEHIGMYTPAVFETQFDGNVLLVSSGGPIATAVAHVLEAPATTVIELNMRIRNSALTEFAFTPKRHMLLSYNTLPHLDHPERAGWVTYT